MFHTPIDMSPKDVERVVQEYPQGTRVEMLADMDDPQPILTGDTGTVEMVDGAGQIHVRWDSGRGLALNPLIDSFKKI